MTTENQSSSSSMSQDVSKEQENKTVNSSGFRQYLRVFRYNDGLGWTMNIIAFICMIASGVVLPLMDVVFGKFVNVFNDFNAGTLSEGGYRSEINKYSLYFVYLWLGKFVLTYGWTVLISITGIHATREMRVEFVRQMIRQEVSYFDQPVSSISSQITTNGNLVSLGISEKLGLTIQAISTFIAAFVVAFAVQWKLTLIVISIVPVNIIVTVVCVAFDTIYEIKILGIYSAAGSIAEEAFSTIRSCHAFWAFPKLTRRFDKILDDAALVGAKKSLVYAILFPTEFFLIYAGYALAFWQGMRMFSEGEIHDPGTVVTVIFAILVAAQALTQIAPQMMALSKASAAASDMFSIIDRESKIESLSTEGSSILDFKGDIKFRDLHFSYPSRPDTSILHGLDLDICEGQTTALVGASGSGKSTIFGLLERWYSPNGGSITLDGQPIESLNLQWLRTNIRLVPQEPMLFSGSIFQNVVDGLVGTDLADLCETEKRERVIESCRAAFAHDFIQDLPQGYDTVIGERGASLSGGQKQRIVIARSIISNPKVLLLDEATSALDPKAEKIVQKALNNIAKGRTMIVIAHRLSTIQTADKIVVMSKGEVIEQGTHLELLQQRGAYSRLVQAQNLGYDSDEDMIDSKEGNMDLDGVSRRETRVSVAADPSSTIDSTIDCNYGLLTGIYMVIKEQPNLWAPLAIGLGSCIIAGGSYPALAVLFSKTMEAFETTDVSRGNFFAAMFFVVACGNFVAYAVAGWLANVIAQHIMKFYRSQIFSNTLRQDMAFFDHPEHGTGALVSRLSTEPTSLQDLISMNLILIIVIIVNLLSSSILGIAYGWKLGLVLSLGALPLLIGAGYVRIRLEFKFEDETAVRFAKSSALASEAVMAIRTVSSLALERAVVERYRLSLEGITRDATASLGWKMFFYALSQSIQFLAMALGFWYGGRLVASGEYTNGQFYVVFIAVIYSGEAAASFFQYTTSITKARTAVNYIWSLRKNQLLDDAGTEDDGNNAEQMSDKSQSGTRVDCEDIRFAYPMRPNLEVLHGINVEIPSGKMVAFVGASGCGKSTMIGLLERFYDPTTGEIRADGRDIKKHNRRDHREGISLVQQEPVLYQGSIGDNIALGVEENEPSEDAIIAACQQANIWEFICSLPDGLGTACGSQGLSLSGGQRQRVAIARALIRQPRLLLLDEATSALDTESEKVVKEALDRAAAGRTTIAVAHRLSTIRDADIIIVFEKGRVIEMGNHEELVARRGSYYDMVLGQSLDQEAS